MGAVIRVFQEDEVQADQKAMSVKLGLFNWVYPPWTRHGFLIRTHQSSTGCYNLVLNTRNVYQQSIPTARGVLALLVLLR